VHQCERGLDVACVECRVGGSQRVLVSGHPGGA
jgi:hypothetical protein